MTLYPSRDILSMSQGHASEIFKCYCEYSRWKGDSGLMDYADATFHALRAAGSKYDVLLVDEIQDFTPLEIVFLLQHIANPHSGHAIAVAGDTAQTITPGCSFRFQRFKVSVMMYLAQPYISPC